MSRFLNTGCVNIHTWSIYIDVQPAGVRSHQTRPDSVHQTVFISANTPLSRSRGSAGRYFYPARVNPFSAKGRTCARHFVKVECDAPEDGDVNLVTRRAVILHPGTEVEEAREQQVEGWHQHSHEEQIKPYKFSLCEVSLQMHSSGGL